jgi:hypothetical protein
MGLFKAWFHLQNEDIDVSLIISATSLREAIDKAKVNAQMLNARLKSVDNIHSGTNLEGEKRKVTHDGRKYS